MSHLEAGGLRSRLVVKPPALQPGAKIVVVSPASPADPERVARGCRELSHLGFSPLLRKGVPPSDGYFAARVDERLAELTAALNHPNTAAVFCARGGYGVNALLDLLEPRTLAHPKILLGYSDITALQIFLWQKLGWVTFCGPMVAAGFDSPSGYDKTSFTVAVTNTNEAWWLNLQGETLLEGEVEGVLLGGCLTLVEASLGTSWELDTRGALLLLEDRGMKPYQVDRSLAHLKQAGKLKDVRGIILGDFPECDPPEGGPPGGVTVENVFERVLGDLGVPIVWRVPVGHSPRPILTLPLGVRARLRAHGWGRLDFLEPAVSPASPAAS